MANVTIVVSSEKIIKMKEFYHEFMLEVKNPYLVFSAKVDGCTINLYTSNKCTFQGENAYDEALIWQEIEDEDNLTITQEIVEKIIKDYKYDDWGIKTNHIGSDEVGTGDFFGPVVVCACYVKNEDLTFINKLGVTDSKKLTDTKIREIGKELIKKITYSSLVCDNVTYNKQIKNGLNMNSIKAILHNRALLNVIKKENLKNPLIIMDQFAEKETYFNYLKNIKDPVVNNIIFKTKAETYAPAVACASIIARYRFLEKMDEYSKLYNLGEIPKGASQLVDIYGQLFIKTHGFDKLNEIAKMNFKNVEKILNPFNLLDN